MATAQSMLMAPQTEIKFPLAFTTIAHSK